MTEDFYCKTYDRDLNLTNTFYSHNEYFVAYTSSIIENNYGEFEIIRYCRPEEYGNLTIAWILNNNLSSPRKPSIHLDPWFKKMGWSLEDGFDTDEKKLMFRLKFL